MAAAHGRAVQRARVQITYDQEGDGDGRRKELPFVLGVLGDFAGKPDPTPPKLREREFVEISRDTFNAVLRNTRPRLQFSVPNKLADDGSKLAVTLHFRGLEDFEPEQVARQVEPLRKLIAVREHLSALRATVRKNGLLGERLREIMRDAEARQTGESDARTRDGRTP